MVTPNGVVQHSAPEAEITRGKEDTWRAPVTVENIQSFTEEMYGDFRRNFIEPMAHGPYRYAINAVRLAAVPDAESEWALMISLDDGAMVRVENFVQWNESKQSYFADGLKRAKAGLARVGRMDPAMHRYVNAVTKPKQPSKQEMMVAKAEAEAKRLED